MVGKITDDKFLSGSLIPTLMDDNPFMTPNTLLTSILGARAVERFTFQEVEQNEAILLGYDHGPAIHFYPKTEHGFDKINSKNLKNLRLNQKVYFGIKFANYHRYIVVPDYANNAYLINAFFI